MANDTVTDVTPFNPGDIVFNRQGQFTVVALDKRDKGGLLWGGSIPYFHNRMESVPNGFDADSFNPDSDIDHLLALAPANRLSRRTSWRTRPGGAPKVVRTELRSPDEWVLLTDATRPAYDFIRGLNRGRGGVVGQALIPIEAAEKALSVRKGLVRMFAQLTLDTALHGETSVSTVARFLTDKFPGVTDPTFRLPEVVAKWFGVPVRTSWRDDNKVTVKFATDTTGPLGALPILASGPKASIVIEPPVELLAAISITNK